MSERMSERMSDHVSRRDRLLAEKRSSGFVSVLRLFGVLIVPLQGQLEDHDADVLTDDVLLRIQSGGCRGLVIDVSGIALLDSHLCAVLARLAQAAQLMGTTSFVAGMSPQIAMTLESMGISMKHVRMMRGLEEALHALGIGRTREETDHDHDHDHDHERTQEGPRAEGSDDPRL